MKNKSPYQKIVERLVPSISELEYVYFISLMVFSLFGYFLFIDGSFVNSVSNEILSRNDNQDINPIYAIYLLVSCIVAISWLIHIGLKARQIKKVKNNNLRRVYVFIPAYIIALLWLLGSIFSNSINLNSITGQISMLVSFRYLALLFFIHFVPGKEKLREQLARQLDDYQMSNTEMSVAIIGGIISSTLTLLLFENKLLGLVIVYSVGSELLRHTRKNLVCSLLITRRSTY